MDLQTILFVLKAICYVGCGLSLIAAANTIQGYLDRNKPEVMNLSHAETRLSSGSLTETVEVDINSLPIFLKPQAHLFSAKALNTSIPHP